MGNISEKIEDLKKRIEKAKIWLNWDEKKKKIEELGAVANMPNFWDIPEKASQMSQELAELKEEIRFWEECERETNDFFDLIKEVKEKSDFEAELEMQILVLEKKIANAEFKFFLSGKYDNKKSILTISAGQGGHDAEDFVRMLFNMYAGYFGEKKWSWEVLSQYYSEESSGSSDAKGERGLKNISLLINASYSYGYLKKETGVHRLVRISPFDAKKLRHTSFALVEVIPDLEEKDLKEVELEEKDLKFDFFKSSGAGGQNVNKRETAVRVVHLPTGLSASCQSERSQAQNREKALRLLKIKIFDYLKNKVKEDKDALKKRVEPSWGNQIRNYVLHPYKLVKDLRTGIETNQVDKVLFGDIDEFIQAEIKLN